jgi:hypothetical protein
MTMSPPEGATIHDGVEGWTIDGRSDDPAILVAATELLDAELPDPRFVSTDYLHWAYRENPLGRAWERNQQIPEGDGARLVAHYAIMPRRFRGPHGERSDGAWSLNAVVRSGHQRARHFSRIGVEIYEEAAGDGRSFVVGVTNEKSTGAVVKYMDWRLLGPLPVRIIQPFGRGSRRVTHAAIDANWLESTAFADLAATVDRHTVAGWSTDYSADVLRWRLACPEASYWIHQTDDVALITTRSTLGPVPACVVLKAFPLTTGTASIDATRTIRAATRFHRAGFAVYAGFNGSVRVRGIRPPRRFQPSPLNLIVRHLDPTVDQDSIVLDTFEFLDMDAY